VAVLPEFQGRGIGKKLVEYYCALLDRSGEASYLETDKPDNVTLYSRFGFEVIKERFVLGIRNWFMWRPATCRQPSVPTTASPD
jgi:ribosomal protein S18 acetylase RimI-like enzyme